ncbi:MAG: serine/threonine-protein kinase [Acidobacteriota bacterium]
MVGKTVHQYQFLEKLGAGGMGEIYRAQDTRLNRFVAIKVLTASTSGDPARRKRFILEAQSASALNHPNIITIHDIISQDDADYMVMEHVIGKTLGELIPRGGLRVPLVLKLGLQITDALNAAHSAGIVHRDLKPGNIMVTDAGLVKVLDFGLAKLTDSSPITGTGPEDATQTLADRQLTVEGSIIGTVSYMSPEQAQGRKIDSRSDIFSIGAVFYEMLTGSRAFQGDSALVTLSGILRDEPRPMLESSPDVPEPLERLVWRCLRKLPDDRFQTMKDVHMTMGGLKSESDSGILYRSAMLTALPSLSAMNPASTTSAMASSAGSAISASTPPAQTAQVSAAQSVTQLPRAAEGRRGRKLSGMGLAAIAIGCATWLLSRRPPVPEPPVVVTAPVPTPEVAPDPVASPRDSTLTNASIIAMLAANVPLPTIFAQMRADKTAFDTSVTGVIALTKAHVPAEVVEAMRHPQSAPILPTTAPGADQAKGSTTPDPAKPAEKGVDKPTVPAGGKQVELKDGTPISIILSADIPDTAEASAPVRFTVKDDILVGFSVAIAKGAGVTGEIAQASKKGLFRGAKMTMRLETVDGVDGRKYSVRAVQASGGADRKTRRVDTDAKPVSENAAASAGTQYIVYVDGDQFITVKK